MPRRFGVELVRRELVDDRLVLALAALVGTERAVELGQSGGQLALVEEMERGIVAQPAPQHRVAAAHHRCAGEQRFGLLIMAEIRCLQRLVHERLRPRSALLDLSLIHI